MMRNSNLKLSEKIRRTSGSERHKNYWVTVIVLSILGAVALVLSPKRRGVNSVFPRPRVASPEYRILWMKETEGTGQKHLSAGVLVKPGWENEVLKLIIDWVLFSILEENNRMKRKNIRVVWVYIYEPPETGLANWRAMGVWVDPRLPEKSWPSGARIGGDAVKEGPVEYDFTNPLSSGDQETGKRITN